MFILVCPYVRHFSVSNVSIMAPHYARTTCTVWPALNFVYDVSLFDFFIYALSTAAMPFQAIKCCANVL
jgi:hypothetical protein